MANKNDDDNNNGLDIGEILTIAGLVILILIVSGAFTGEAAAAGLLALG